MKHTLYFLLAVFLLVVLLPVAILSTAYTYIFHHSTAKMRFNRLLFTIALSIDGFGNVILSSLFNRVLITDDGYHYGNWYETISQVTGENELMGTLTKRGIWFKDKVNKYFGENHCVKSVRMKELRCKRYLNRVHKIK